ncbi:L,D-transpeptidase [filamentous cyanobacterium LEGE 11480]|uniref:L,D-transpeptidase n=1 Tax=Romeriopsis navalis LEGE 11480 TaxID=2777977 RepID=A0A928Z556_9CYAN|nr:L,D-transpeptidase [Romeriopsis navalis]MBE9030905.1 L,D-transpeptidase [Romeriopsis navalis LEGE 11480]
MNSQPRRYVSVLLAVGICLSAGSAAVAQASGGATAEPTLAETPGNVLTQPTAPTPATVTPAATEAPLGSVVKESVVRLVLKRSKRRVYVYKDDKVVSSYPVAVGKRGWETPLGQFKVLNMEKNPTFKSFKSGVIIPPGPDNPLGVRWIGIWTDGKTQLGFHGTDQPHLIGRAVSHGCIRMHNRDVVRLYAQVKPGTAVKVIP